MTFLVGTGLRGVTVVFDVVDVVVVVAVVVDVGNGGIFVDTLCIGRCDDGG